MLSKFLKIDKGNITRSIKKLEEQGYITRIKNQNDSRSYNLNLTKKALDKKNDFLSILKNWTKIISNNFSQDELQLTFSFLNKMTENAKSYLDR